MPFKEFLIVWLVCLCAALPISSLFPFLYFLIRDLNIVKKEEDIGFYAGYVGTFFMFGRTLTSLLWGIMADKYGRKPVIVFGFSSVIIFNTLFGLSINYWMAISTRFLLGSLNGLLGPVKAYAVEVSPPEYQASALSLVKDFKDFYVSRKTTTLANECGGLYLVGDRPRTFVVDANNSSPFHAKLWLLH